MTFKSFFAVVVCLAAGLAACEQSADSGIVPRRGRSKLASGAGGEELLQAVGAGGIGGGAGPSARRGGQRRDRRQRRAPRRRPGAGGAGLSGSGGTFSVAGSGGGGCVSNGCAPPINPCYSNTCNLTTGLCDAGYADGVICDDGNQCTQGERCAERRLRRRHATKLPSSGSVPRRRRMHERRVLQPAETGRHGVQQSERVHATDTCQNGMCIGSSPMTCAAINQCHDAGTCNTATGVCSTPIKANGTTCNDQNACSRTDTCQNGACTGGNPVDVHSARPVPRRRHMQPVDRDLLEPQQDQRRVVQRRTRVHDGRHGVSTASAREP